MEAKQEIKITSDDICECGHLASDHIYMTGKCRPGYRCNVRCQEFKGETMSEVTKIIGSALIENEQIWNEEKIDLLKRTICKGASNDELQMFLGVCKRTQLDPFMNQIFAVKRYDSTERREVMKAQVSIDGARIVAERSGQYDGQEGPFWCGEDGVWKEIWASESTPFAAKVVVFKKGVPRGTPAVAHWDEYVAKKKDGTTTMMWATKPALMLAKCAEMLALRKAFPNDLSGLYSGEEMSQISPDKPIHGADAHVTDVHISLPKSETVVFNHKDTNQDRVVPGGPKEGPISAQIYKAVAGAKDVTSDFATPSDEWDYTIPDGALKGTKLSDKSEKYWKEYRVALSSKLNENAIPEEYVKSAKEILAAVNRWLND